jgi:hypothetical protein
MLIKIVKENMFKLGSLLLIIFTSVMINNRYLTLTAQILTFILITRLLMECTDTKISLPKLKVVKKVKKTIGLASIIFISVIMIFSVIVLSGSISMVLGGAYGIHQRDWLQFVGGFLSSIFGLVSGYLGAMVYLKNKTKAS